MKDPSEVLIGAGGILIGVGATIAALAVACGVGYLAGTVLAVTIGWAT